MSDDGSSASSLRTEGTPASSVTSISAEDDLSRKSIQEGVSTLAKVASDAFVGIWYVLLSLATFEDEAHVAVHPLTLESHHGAVTHIADP